MGGEMAGGSLSRRSRPDRSAVQHDSFTDAAVRKVRDRSAEVPSLTSQGINLRWNLVWNRRGRPGPGQKEKLGHFDSHKFSKYGKMQAKWKWRWSSNSMAASVLSNFYCSNSDCTVSPADSLPLCCGFILESTLVQKLQTNNSNAKIPPQKKKKRSLSDLWRGEKRQREKKKSSRREIIVVDVAQCLVSGFGHRRAPFLSDTKST